MSMLSGMIDGLANGLVENITGGGIGPVVNFNFLNSNFDVSQIDCDRNTVATYTNSDGEYAQAAVDVARIEHSFPNGDIKGLIVEEGRTCKNEYARPSADTVNDHFTTGAADVSVVTDASVPITSDFTNNDQVWEVSNTSGGDLTIEWAGTTGNTNIHNIQILYKIVSGDGFAEISISGNGPYTGVTPSVGLPILNARVWDRQIGENITPATINDVMRLVIPDGMTIRFVFANMQEDRNVNNRYYSHVTNPIDTAGASASRSGEFNTVDFDALNIADGYTVAVSGQFWGGENNNCGSISLYPSGDTGTHVQFRALQTGEWGFRTQDGSGNNPFDVNFGEPQPHPIDISYAARIQDGDSVMYSQGSELSTSASSLLPDSVDRLSFYRSDSSTNNESTQIFESIRIYSQGLSNNQVSSLSFRGIRYPVYGIGQSNQDIYFRGFGGASPQYDDGDKGGGQIFMEREINKYVAGWRLIRGATDGGGSLLKQNDPGSGYYWDEDTQELGTQYTNIFLPQYANFKNIQPRWFIWDQWQFDSNLTVNEVETIYAPNLQAFFEALRANHPNTNILVHYPAYRNGTTDDVTEAFRKALYDAVEALDYVYGAIHPFIFDINTPVSPAHWAVETNYITQGLWDIRWLMKEDSFIDLHGVEGPRITSATYDDNTDEIKLSIALDDTPSLTPTTGIDGFLVEVNGSPATITQTDVSGADEVTITLSANIFETDEVYVTWPYEFDVSTTSTNKLRDDGAWSMPLQYKPPFRASTGTFALEAATFNFTGGELAFGEIGLFGLEGSTLELTGGDFEFASLQAEWAQVGNDYTTEVFNAKSVVARLNSGQIVLANGTDLELKAFDWDGTDLSHAGGNDLAFAGFTSDIWATELATDVFLFSPDGNSFTDYSWDGTDFTAGDTIAIGGDTRAGGASATRFFTTERNDGVRCYEKNGTWSQLGNTYTGATIGFANHDVTVLDNTEDAEILVIYSRDDSEFTVLSFDGTNFSVEATGTFATAQTQIALARLSDTSWAYQDANETLYEFSYSGSTITQGGTIELDTDLGYVFTQGFIGSFEENQILFSGRQTGTMAVIEYV